MRICALLLVVLVSVAVTAPQSQATGGHAAVAVTFAGAPQATYGHAIRTDGALTLYTGLTDGALVFVDALDATGQVAAVVAIAESMGGLVEIEFAVDLDPDWVLPGAHFRVSTVGGDGAINELGEAVLEPIEALTGGGGGPEILPPAAGGGPDTAPPVTQHGGGGGVNPLPPPPSSSAPGGGGPDSLPPALGGGGVIGIPPWSSGGSPGVIPPLATHGGGSGVSPLPPPPADAPGGGGTDSLPPAGATPNLGAEADGGGPVGGTTFKCNKPNGCRLKIVTTTGLEIIDELAKDEVAFVSAATTLYSTCQCD